MQIVILAGGLATRLRPLTEKIPKSMMKVCGRPFLEYQIDRLKEQGVKDIVLCIGYLGDRIQRHFEDGKKFGVTIRYSDEREQLLDTAGALRNAKNLLQGEFFVMYGDSCLFLDFQAIASYFHQFRKLALMVVYKNYNRYDESNVAVEKNLIRSYSKKLKTNDMVYIDYGASLMRKTVLNLIPKNTPYSLEEFFSELISHREVLAFEVKRRFYEIGSKKGLTEFQTFISERGA